jgi:putative lipoprotein
MPFRSIGLIDGVTGFALTILLAACAQGTRPLPASGIVSGTITYRERIALPPDAVAEIWIADVSPGMIVPQALLGETTVRSQGKQVPLAFELKYDPARAEPTHTYALKAVIKSSDGQTLFTSGDSAFVITQGHPSRVDLVLRRGSQGADGGRVVLPGRHGCSRISAEPGSWIACRRRSSFRNPAGWRATPRATASSGASRSRGR